MKRFKDWLKAKASDAQMSAKEVAEFTSWLVFRRQQSTNVSKATHKKSRLTPSDVHEFLGWLQRGMNEASLNEDERAQLNGWVSDRMREDPDCQKLSEESPHEDFEQWLRKSMDDANLTAEERAELQSWIVARAKEDPAFAWLSEANGHGEHHASTHNRDKAS